MGCSAYHDPERLKGMASSASEKPRFTNFISWGIRRICFYGGVILANLKRHVETDYFKSHFREGVGSGLRHRATLSEHP